jgi:hypothetical protein
MALQMNTVIAILCPEKFYHMETCYDTGQTIERYAGDMTMRVATKYQHLGARETGYR